MKREGDWGDNSTDVCYKNPLLFICAPDGVRKILIAVITAMSILWMCISKKLNNHNAATSN